MVPQCGGGLERNGKDGWMIEQAHPHTNTPIFSSEKK